MCMQLRWWTDRPTLLTRGGVKTDDEPAEIGPATHAGSGIARGTDTAQTDARRQPTSSPPLAPPAAPLTPAYPPARLLRASSTSTSGMPAPHTTGAPIKKSTLELVVPQFVPFETRLDPDAPPVVLHGRLRIRLRRETTFKNAVVDCRGALTIMPVKTAAWKPDSRIVYLSSVSLLGPGPTTLAAGVHEYPFAMTLSPDMPCSLPDAGGMARVVYTLRARATKTKTGVLRKAVAKVGGLVMPWRGALECERPVDLARAYPRESIEFQNVHEGALFLVLCCASSHFLPCARSLARWPRICGLAISTRRP